MPKPCPDCDTAMYPADDISCSQANFVCPECAPDFVLALSTTFSDIEPQEFGVKRTVGEEGDRG